MNNMNTLSNNSFKGVGYKITVKEMLLREISEGSKVIIVDPENEYKELSSKLPSKLYGKSINPLEIRLNGKGW